MHKQKNATAQECKVQSGAPADSNNELTDGGPLNHQEQLENATLLFFIAEHIDR